MNPPLRPMRLGEILDRTFQIYRQHFWVFVGLSLLPAAGMTLLQFLNLFWWKVRVPDLIRIAGINFGYIVYVVGQYHCSLFFHALVWPLLATAASQAHLGIRPGIRSSFSARGPRWRSWIGLALLLQSLVVVLAEFAAIALFLGLAALASWLSKDSEAFMDPFLTFIIGVMIVAGYVFSLWLGTLYLGAVPAWCAEGLGLRKSFKRSRELSELSRWRLLCVRLVPIVMILVLDVAAATSVRLAVIYGGRALHHELWIYGNLYASVYAVCTGAVSAVLTPVFPIALTLIYYDQRIRKEGFDIEWMMQSAGMVESSSVATAPVESAELEPASVQVEEAGAP